MKKQLIIGIAVLFLSVGLSGCTTENRDSRFVGTWGENPVVQMTLFSDGSCSFAGSNGNWQIKDNKLNLELDNGASFVYDYYFSEDETILYLKTLSSDTYTALTKQ